MAEEEDFFHAIDLQNDLICRDNPNGKGTCLSVSEIEIASEMNRLSFLSFQFFGNRVFISFSI